MRRLRQWRHTLSEIANHPLNRGRVLRAIASYAQWNIGRRFVQASYVMPLGSARIILSNDENYATLAYVNQLWDFAEMTFLLHLLRPEDLFIDIGANAGAYAILASAIGGARSIAIEPVPETFSKLRTNVRMNDVDETVELYNIGLAEAEGTLRFTSKRGGCNHVLIGSSGVPEVAVQVSTLDQILSDRVPLLIKIDVEGYELPVFQGAPKCLSNPDLKAVIVELNGTGMRYGHSDAEVHRFLGAQGFEPFDYHPFERALVPRSGFDGTRFNTLYVRSSDDVVQRRLATAPKMCIRNHEI